MSSLTISPISIRYLEAEGGWETTAPVSFRDGLSAFKIPKGFRTDLASVPRFLWPIFPPYGLYLRAALVHDFLYDRQPVSRVQADALFLAAMEVYGVPAWKRWAMYLAVRGFGWRPWKANAAA